MIRCIRAQVAVHSPAPYNPQQIAPGTRVLRLYGDRAGMIRGTVQKHRPNQLGTFPVAWADGFWEICAADDVVVVDAPAGTGAA